ncbi:MAG: 16S rRNA processing protein RimM [Firmicutes bacterium]|nr:16S rRNA processing protein RimM [Bacillota bacterium]
MFRVGIVTSTHGIGGTVKVFPTTQDPRRFLELEKLGFSRDDQEENIRGWLTIDKVQFQKDMVLLHFKGVGSVETALKLKGGSLWIEDDQAISLEEDEFYLRDLFEAEVISDEGEMLGRVTDILETSANYVLEVSSDGSEPLLVPVIKDCILKMDCDQKRITVHLLDGLRETGGRN